MIDPRTLVPLDLETMARVGPAHRAARWSPTRRCAAGGFGAEIAAQVQAAAFDCLEAPIQRVGAPFTPVPVSPPLEDAYRPAAPADLHAARAALDWGRYAVEPWDEGRGSARSPA